MKPINVTNSQQQKVILSREQRLERPGKEEPPRPGIELLNLLNKVDHIRNPEREDRISWSNNSRGLFSIKDCYQVLEKERNIIENRPWKIIWKTKAP